MALAFPTPLSDFFDKLPIMSARPNLTESQETNETGGGEILTAMLGPRLWEMDIVIRNGPYDDLEEIRSLINVYRQPGRFFYASAIPRRFPKMDPRGSILGSASVTLHTVNGNQRDIRLTGLPNGYKLSAGDYLSFQYGNNPTRFAFHQLVSSVNASSGGLTPLFEVSPNLRPGYAIGTAVRLIKPYFKALILPGSADMGESGKQETRGISFTIRQTLRG